MTYDLYEFVPLTKDLYEQAMTTDYNEAVERLEYNGHIIIERCLADCCEVIANNTDSDEEAFDRIIEDGDMMYPLSEWGRKAQFEIYKQWSAQFDK